MTTEKKRIDILKDELEILRSREEYSWSETAAMEEAARRDLVARAEKAEAEVARLREIVGWSVDTDEFKKLQRECRELRGERDSLRAENERLSWDAKKESK